MLQENNVAEQVESIKSLDSLVNIVWICHHTPLHHSSGEFVCKLCKAKNSAWAQLPTLLICAGVFFLTLSAAVLPFGNFSH